MLADLVTLAWRSVIRPTAIRWVSMYFCGDQQTDPDEVQLHRLLWLKDSIVVTPCSCQWTEINPLG